MKEFTIPEIRVFLAANLPYFESEDKDEFLYIAKASDIEKLSKALYTEFKCCEESANATDACTCKYPKPNTYNTYAGQICIGCGFPRR